MTSEAIERILQPFHRAAIRLTEETQRLSAKLDEASRLLKANGVDSASLEYAAKLVADARQLLYSAEEFIRKVK